MNTITTIDDLLTPYSEQVIAHCMLLREIVLHNLPGITEQVDAPAKMIAYCYGQQYADLICVIIPSQKGVKLGFNRGVDLGDPDNLLEGNGKISRHVSIKTSEQISAAPLRALIKTALELYQQRQKGKN